jgi:hypothetical protein
MITTSRPMPHLFGRDGRRSTHKDSERASRAAGRARVQATVT